MAKQYEKRPVEYWDAYDVNRQPTGNIWERGETGKPGEYRMIVVIYVINAKGEMLAQLRSPKHPPEVWTFSAGGSSLTGETSQAAAQRELLEEIGIDYDFSDTRPRFTIHAKPGFFDYYVIEADVDIETLKLQDEEVQAVKWFSKEEIRAMIKTGDRKSTRLNSSH